MGYKTQSPREAWFKTQHGWTPYVDLLALQMGVNLQIRGHIPEKIEDVPKNYEKIPYKEVDTNTYSRHHMDDARDLIVYPTPGRVPYHELLNADSTVIDGDADFAFVQECDNSQSNKAVTFNVKFIKGLTATRSKSKTRKEGWSFENETKFGVEVHGVSFENTTTIGAHGEYEKQTALENQDMNGLETTIDMVIEGGEHYKIEQFQRKAEVEVINLERMAFELAFDVYCSNERWRNLEYLKDNKRIIRWRGTKHSYRMLSINSANDLRELLVGVHPDYPHQRRNLLTENNVIRNCYEVLIDTERWCLEAEERIKFDNALHSVIRIRNMNPKHEEDQFVDPISLLKNASDADKLAA